MAEKRFQFDVETFPSEGYCVLYVNDIALIKLYQDELAELIGVQTEALSRMKVPKIG